MMTNYYTAKLIADERIKDALGQAEKTRLVRAVRRSRKQQARQQRTAWIKRLTSVFTGRRVEEQCQALPTTLDQAAALECTS